MNGRRPERRQDISRCKRKSTERKPEAEGLAEQVQTPTRVSSPVGSGIIIHSRRLVSALCVGTEAVGIGCRRPMIQQRTGKQWRTGSIGRASHQNTEKQKGHQREGLESEGDLGATQVMSHCAYSE